MKGLVDLVNEFGMVPKDQILDEFGYKAIYNDELLKMVRVREVKIARGELSLEDVYPEKCCKTAGIAIQ